MENLNWSATGIDSQRIFAISPYFLVLLDKSVKEMRGGQTIIAYFLFSYEYVENRRIFFSLKIFVQFIFFLFLLNFKKIVRKTLLKICFFFKP